MAPERPARDHAAQIDPRADALARLFEEVHEGVYIGLVSATGSRTLAANPHLKLMLGYAAETPETDVRPFDPSRFNDPQARESFRERLIADGAVTEYLLRLRRADGSPCWVELTAHAEPGAPTARSAWRRSMRDVSERKKMDDQSRDLYQQLLQAEKMAALGQTISGVAHELNNPLATILTWSERLAQKPLDERTRRGIEIILHEAERAAKIVRQLLTFARKRQTHADDGRSQPGRARNARAARLRAARDQHRRHRRARRRACRRCSPIRIKSSRCCST